MTEIEQDVLDRHFCAICQIPLPPRRGRGRWPKTCTLEYCKLQYSYLHAFDRRREPQGLYAVKQQQRRLREWVRIGPLEAT